MLISAEGGPYQEDEWVDVPGAGFGKHLLRLFLLLPCAFLTADFVNTPPNPLPLMGKLKTLDL